MGNCILCQNIMNIIGCHQVNSQFPAHTHQTLIYGFLHGNSVILKFQEEIPFSKYFLIMKSRTACFLIHSPSQIPLHLAGQTG